MHIPVLIFQWLVAIADAIIYSVISFFGVIIILAFAMADGDDYWAGGGMPLPSTIFLFLKAFYSNLYKY